jgi:protein tyrosine/serine phosphatase
MRRQPILNFFLTCALAVPVFAGSSTPGIENFHQVNAHVFRGAQPSEEGFRYLAKLGVKTIVDLRESDARSRKEEQQVTAAGMKYVNVPMTGLTPPTQAEIARILGILEDDSSGVVFVHCKRGADRTGAVIASYRIDHDGWDSSRALGEAKAEGMSFFQLPRQDYIRTFQARKLEAKAAAPASSSPVVEQRVAQ